MNSYTRLAGIMALTLGCWVPSTFADPAGSHPYEFSVDYEASSDASAPPLEVIFEIVADSTSMTHTMTTGQGNTTDNLSGPSPSSTFTVYAQYRNSDRISKECVGHNTGDIVTLKITGEPNDLRGELSCEAGR